MRVTTCVTSNIKRQVIEAGTHQSFLFFESVKNAKMVVHAVPDVVIGSDLLFMLFLKYWCSQSTIKNRMFTMMLFMADLAV